MADMETILNWVGYDNSFDYIRSRMTEEDLKELFQQLWYECEYQEEVVEELAHEEGFVDHEQVKADYEDQKYQEFKERHLDD